MKNLISLIFCLIVGTILVFGNESFYYSGDKKIMLKEDISKLAILTPNNKQSNNINLNEITSIKKYYGDYSNVEIYYRDSVISSHVIHNLLNDENSSSHFIPCYVNEEGLELCPNGYIYVELKDKKDLLQLEKVSNDFNCRIIGNNSFMPLWYTLRISFQKFSNPIEIANKIFETGYFSSSIPGFSFDPSELSYDPDITFQWSFYNNIKVLNERIDIDISQAWNFATGRSVKIAIVDEGVELMHTDLSDNIYPISYYAPTNTVYYSKEEAFKSIKPRTNHGTHCAGIAAAVRNNGILISGVAPDAQIMSAHCDYQKDNAIEQLANSINWAWQNGADIISCSWHCGEDQRIKQAIDAALTYGRNGKGCIVVKSAGNTGESITFPGNYREEIIAVGNIKNSGYINNSSCHGENLLLCAPGTDILSTLLNNSSGYMTGTSMAAPHVSGVAALILDRNPNLTNEEVREILATNTTKLNHIRFNKTKKYGSWDEYYGYGLLNAYKCVVNTPIFFH